jgi:flagellum-specific peptidoglycan hydrolase FlgJ
MPELSNITAAVTTCGFAASVLAFSVYHMLGPKRSPQAPPLPDSVTLYELRDADIIEPVPAEMLLSADPGANREATQVLISQIEANWPDDHRRAFLSSIAPHALDSAVEHCVPPSITLAQAILESGWGRSKLATRHHNLFGMKSGALAGGINLLTREVEAGESTRHKARFRTYEQWDQSISDHGNLISADPRYAEARTKWEHWPLFLETLAPIYATDPKYVARISSLVDDYHLDRWDALVSGVAQRRSSCASWAKP